MWIYNGKVIKEGRAWTNDDGIKHPASWSRWTAAEKANAGLVEVTVQPQPDARFYWVTGPSIDGTWSSVARILEDRAEVDEDGNPLLDEDGVQLVTTGLKTQYINQTKQTANSQLSQTDWQVIAHAERGRVLDSDVITYRAAVLASCNAIIDAIAACNTLDAFKLLFDTPVDADGIPVGNPPMSNWPR